jgi:hypothetical protein
MEVLGDRSVNQMRQNLALYHSLLREGHRITLVGSANSRFGGVEEIGYPRTYIAADDSDPRAIDPDEVFESLRRGHAFVTSGPWIEFSIRGNQMGDMFAWEMGEAVEIEYSVKCPGWISLAFIDISKEGNFVQRMTLPGDRSVAPVRVWSPPEGNNKFMVRHDHIFTVEVTGGRPIEPLNPANPGAAQFIPVALSNPIWVDTDGNGRYDHYDYD